MASRLATIALVTGALALSGGAGASPHSALAANVPDLGPNVKIFDPSMSTAEIKATVDAIAAQQVSNQFGTERYALLFMPGSYGSAGRRRSTSRSATTRRWPASARSPNDVSVNGTIDVYNQCFGPGDCTALVNFWRAMSNLTINVAGKGGCQFGEFWATSQAAPMRRVHVNGHTTLMDYCSSPAFASGGFIADSQFTSTVVNGSQQQYLVRNSSLAGWSNGVWNQVFAGVAERAARSPSRTRPTRRSTRPRPRARSRSSTSTRDGGSTSTSPTCGSTPRARPGPTARRPAGRSRSSASSSPSPRTASRRSTRPCRAASTSSSPPASTTSTRRSR